MVGVGKFDRFDCVTITQDLKDLEWDLRHTGSLSISRQMWVAMLRKGVCLGMTFHWCALRNGGYGTVGRMEALLGAIADVVRTQLHAQETEQEAHYQVGFSNPEYAAYITSVARNLSIEFTHAHAAVSLDTGAGVAMLAGALKTGANYAVRLDEERGKRNGAIHMIGIAVIENDGVAVLFPELGEVVTQKTQLPQLLRFYLDVQRGGGICYDTAEPFAAAVADCEKP